jgi:hypothetical protein
LFGDAEEKTRREEEAIEAIRKKFGDSAISSGRFYAKRLKPDRTVNEKGDSDE